MISYLRFIYAMCALAVATVTHAGELDERAQIKLEVANFFAQEDFAALNALALAYDDPSARTSSGLWKSTIFYTGLENGISFRGREASHLDRLTDRVDRWQDAYPDSNAAMIATAIVHDQYAWHLRGGGYANSVPDENWPLIRKHLRIAYDHLEAVHPTAAADPNWYVYQLGILNTLNASPKDYTSVLDEGIDRHPEFYQLYFAGMDYFMPKWGGDDKALDNFIQDAALRTEVTDGDGMYARMYWYASQAQYRDRLFTDSNVDWRRMRQGIFDVIGDYPDDWNIQNFARFACLAEDSRTTQRLMAMMKDRPIQRVWRDASAFNFCAAL